MSRSFATQALSRTATNITKQSTISTQNTFTFFKFVSPNLVAGLKNTMSSAQFGWSPTHPPRACCTSLVLELHLLITPPLLAKSPFVPLRGITWLPQPIWAGPPHLPQAPFEHKVSVSVEEGQGHLQPGNIVAKSVFASGNRFFEAEFSEYWWWIFLIWRRIFLILRRNFPNELS